MLTNLNMSLLVINNNYRKSKTMFYLESVQPLFVQMF